MKINLYRALMLLATLLVCQGAFAQPSAGSLRSPFDFDLLLSASFGELRSSHYHAGIDIKTQGVTGKPIRCVADGYICRAKVQAAGYGLALYVMHDGYMTVYGHLDRFPSNIAKRVHDYQYDKERFEVDLHFAAGEYPVKKGAVLAHAGNSGYSFGPHLHFEVRDESGNELYNPILYYKSKIKDTRPPRASAVAIYPRQGRGALFGAAASASYAFKGNHVPDTIEAWGSIAFGIEALDYMNDTNNKYGIYRTELFVDGKQCFVVQMDNFSFAEYGMIKACVDKRRASTDEGTFQKLFIVANNRFGEYKADEHRGWLNVDSERLYNVEIRLTDYHGNKNHYHLVVRGKQCNIPQPERHSAPSHWSADNSLATASASLYVPARSMYDDAYLALEDTIGGVLFDGCTASSGDDVAFHRSARLSLNAEEMPGVPLDKLCIVRVSEKDTSWVGGKYANGRVTAEINAPGKYLLSADTVPPTLKPVGEKQWMKNARLVFTLADGESNISSFRGTLNGKFVLFKYNRKDKRLTFDFAQENIRRGNHKLRVVAVDAYGNRTIFEKNIKY